MKSSFFLRKQGFTLAELLLALVILAVVATFTIPKILVSQQRSAYAAIAKESAATISSAYHGYKLSGQANANSGIASITSYLNYVRVDTVSTFDEVYGSAGNRTCSSFAPCYILQNGALLQDNYSTDNAGGGNHFGGTSRTNYVYYLLDPDRVLTSSASAQGPGKTIIFVLYFDGRITDFQNCNAGDTTYNDATVYNTWCPGSGSPDWFSW